MGRYEKTCGTVAQNTTSVGQPVVLGVPHAATGIAQADLTDFEPGAVNCGSPRYHYGSAHQLLTSCR